MITCTEALEYLVEVHGDRIALREDGALTLGGWPAGNIVEHVQDAPDALHVAMLVDWIAGENERLACRCGGAVEDRCTCLRDPLGMRGRAARA
jgi:hypothetical protein